MNRCERRYRGVIGSIGLTLVLFLILMTVSSSLVLGLELAVRNLPNAVMAEIVYQLVYALLYLLPFMLPVLAMKVIFGVRKLPYAPMKAELKISPLLPLILFAGVFVILVQAYFNAFFVGLIHYSFPMESGVTGEPYQIVLQFITMCLVPGFCEEFLFRGAIMTNCMPFGRGRAIFISAFLFALMHQNVGQFLYSFAAGILLGIVYDLTGSLWNCILLHTVNNYVPVIQSTALARLSDRAGPLVCVLVEAVICLLGAISLVILIFRCFGTRPAYENGFFGRELRASDAYAQCPVSSRRILQLSMTPAMLFYVVYCLLQLILLIPIVLGGFYAF